MVSAHPASMRVLHIHHWDIRNLCFLLRIPDTSMIENIIMSSHAPQINVNGLIVVIFGWKILPSRAGLEPTQMCVNPHKACAFASSATQTDLHFLYVSHHCQTLSSHGNWSWKTLFYVVNWRLFSPSSLKLTTLS